MCLNIAHVILSGLVPAVGLKDSTPGTPESFSDSRHKMFAVRNKASSSSGKTTTATATAAAATAVDTASSSHSAAAAPTKRASGTSRLSRSYSRSASEA
jgi:hypothetical protein